MTQVFHFIIGHIPYLGNCALNLKDLCQDLGITPKVFLLAHALPRTEENDIDEDVLLDWLKDTDVVFSIGENVKSDIDAYITCLQEADRPIHKIYLPGCPAELLTIMQEERAKPLKGPQNITVMMQERKD